MDYRLVRRLVNMVACVSIGLFLGYYGPKGIRTKLEDCEAKAAASAEQVSRQVTSLYAAQAKYEGCIKEGERAVELLGQMHRSQAKWRKCCQASKRASGEHVRQP